MFGRIGVADDDVDPVGWAVSGGIGGRGMIPTRENDSFGVGYYYNHIVDTRFFGLVGIDDHAQGVEAFYNIAITPAARLTIDIQYVDAALPDVDDDVVIGARFSVQF